MACGEKGYSSMYVSYTSRNNYSEKFAETVGEMSEDNDNLGFHKAKSCLSLGSGVGLNEIRFIQHLMPNLEIFTAVEPDAESVVELRTNFERHLPDVKTVVHQMNAEDFITSGNADNRQLYDVILAFRVIYFFDRKSRPLLYTKLRENFLDDRGSIVFSWMSRTDHPEHIVNILHYLKPARSYPTEEDIVNDSAKAGLHVYRQYEYRYWCDFTSPDETLRQWISFTINRLITMEELQSAIKLFWPNGRSENNFYSFYILKKSAEHSVDQNQVLEARKRILK